MIFRITVKKRSSKDLIIRRSPLQKNQTAILFPMFQIYLSKLELTADCLMSDIEGDLPNQAEKSAIEWALNMNSGKMELLSKMEKVYLCF